MDINFEEILFDKIKGALYGAYIADSIGSAVEFSTSLTKKQIDEAMKMNGSDIFGTGPGQITDDSELSLALGLALDSSTLNLDKIARRYGIWAGSKPFDIGNTTGHSMRKVIGAKESDPSAKIMMKAAEDLKESKSNGCLMKLMPLCLWARNLNKPDLWVAIESECRLTHFNPYNHYINYCYALLVQLILREENLSLSKKELYGILKKSINEENDTEMKKVLNDCFELAENKNIREEVSDMGIGFIKLAFSLALNIFIKDLDYFSSIRYVLTFCGDTDTNAAILGGLLGCYFGANQIDDDYINCLMSFDGSDGIRRPDEFIPKNSLPKVIENVRKYAPTSLDMNTKY